jgi:hypothetical protein
LNLAPGTHADGDDLYLRVFEPDDGTRTRYLPLRGSRPDPSQQGGQEAPMRAADGFLGGENHAGDGTHGRKATIGGRLKGTL